MSIGTLQADWLLSPGHAPLQNALLRFDRTSGRIVSVESPAPKPEESDSQWVWILTPGLINAHTHLELYRETPIAMAPGDSMATWLLQAAAYGRSLTPADKLRNCQQSILECIRTGTTCVNDITSTGAALEALSQVGMRGVVSPEFFAPSHQEHPDLSWLIQQFQALQQRFASHPLLCVGLSPHSPYNVSPAACREALSACQPGFVHTHCAETRAELTWFHSGQSVLDDVHQQILGRVYGPSQTGVTPFEAYQSLWDSRWMLAHGVYLSELDWDRLIQQQVGVAHCSRSNMALSQTTIHQLAHRLTQGAAIGLGTDSRLSCPSLDLREEARFCQQHHGLSAQAVFELATMGSAKVIKQADHLGQLQPGYVADMVLWAVPRHVAADPFALWLHPETQVHGVWIQGRVVLEKAI